MKKKFENIEPAPIMFVFLFAKQLSKLGGISFSLSVLSNEYNCDLLWIFNADIVSALVELLKFGWKQTEEL